MGGFGLIMANWLFELGVKGSSGSAVGRGPDAPGLPGFEPGMGLLRAGGTPGLLPVGVDGGVTGL